MRQWVLQVEHIWGGSWAKEASELTNAEVGRRFDAYLAEMAQFVAADARTDAVPLMQPEGIQVDEETQQATEDWHYWVNRGYKL